jgi:hypothetical protein
MSRDSSVGIATGYGLDDRGGGGGIRKNAVHSWAHTFRKADESLVWSDKTWQVSSNLHYYIQKQVQLLSLLSMNIYIAFLQF